MPIIFSIILGIVQGITEFLPISSDGHLVAVQVMLGQALQVRDVPLAYDVALHAATLIVTFYYLRADVFAILGGLLAGGDRGRRAWSLVLVGAIASFPVAVVGLLLKHQIEQSFSSAILAGFGFFVTAALLELAHRRQKATSNGEAPQSMLDLTWPLPSPKQALIIGLAQATAVLPGVSRSGTTITSALLLGLPATTAVRFSFLLALPSVLGAVLLEAKDITQLPDDYRAGLLVGFLVTLAVGSVAIRLVPIIVSRLKLRWFAWYLVALGTFVIAVSL